MAQFADAPGVVGPQADRDAVTAKRIAGQCAPGPDEVSAADVIAERLSGLDVPIVIDAPVGHVPENTPLLFGAHAKVDADRGHVAFELR